MTKLDEITSYGKNGNKLESTQHKLNICIFVFDIEFRQMALEQVTGITLQCICYSFSAKNSRYHYEEPNVEAHTDSNTHGITI